MALNSVALSSDFIIRLKNEVEMSIKKHFVHNLSEISKVETIFSELHQMSNQFRNAVFTNLKSVAKTLEPSLRDISEFLNQGSYVLNEKEYTNRQIDEDANWPAKMSKQLQALVNPFRRELLQLCWDTLSKIFTSSIAIKLERLVMAKKYNALGALQLSKDVSEISRLLIQLCPQARSDMARLTQMAVTLCVESCKDVEDLAAAPQWRLTPGETRRMLSKRVEFSQAEIAEIKL
jgi:hypothetical protein